MTRYFFVLESAVDAMYPDGSSAQTKHAAISAGAFSTVDEDLAAFFRRGYPGVAFLSSQEETIVEPSAEQFGPRPAPVRVLKDSTDFEMWNRRRQ